MMMSWVMGEKVVKWNTRLSLPHLMALRTLSLITAASLIRSCGHTMRLSPESALGDINTFCGVSY